MAGLGVGGEMKRKAVQLIPTKIFYLWQKLGLKRIELFTMEDVEKKPVIPECSSAVARLKEATNRAQERQQNIFKKLRRRI